MRYALQSVATRISRERSTDSVVLVCGTYDLLHTGHVRYLLQAKKRGTLLVVGVNCDEVVRARKGACRPYIDERRRAAMLAALSCVDFVFIARKNFFEKALSLVRPDVLILPVEEGRRAEMRNIAQRTKCNFQNVRPVFIRRQDLGISTTIIEERIRHCHK